MDPANPPEHRKRSSRDARLSVSHRDRAGPSVPVYGPVADRVLIIQIGRRAWPRCADSHLAQYLHRMPSALRDLRCGYPCTEPGRHRSVPQVVRPSGQRRRDLAGVRASVRADATRGRKSPSPPLRHWRPNSRPLAPDRSARYAHGASPPVPGERGRSGVLRRPMLQTTSIVHLARVGPTRPGRGS